MKYDRVQIQQIAQIIQGGRHGHSGNDFVRSGYPAYGAGGMNGYLPTFEFDREAVVLSSIGARCGKCFYVQRKWTSLANTQVILPDCVRVNAKFLWFQLDDEKRWPRSGTGQPFIKPSDVKVNEIALPPLPEQQRIAALLDRANRVRRMRRYVEELSASFLQSVFVRMFGDPVKNPRGWETDTVEEILAKNRAGIRTGPFGSSLKRAEYTREGVPVWGINNVRENEFVKDGSLFISESKYRALSLYSVDDGDILISRAGTVGRMCVAHPFQSPSIIGSNLLRVALDHSAVISEYFTTLFTYFASRVGRLKMSSDDDAYSFINPMILRSMKIFVPPLALQQEFARIVQRHERLRAQQREASRQAEHLFQTLLHRAFRGEP